MAYDGEVEESATHEAQETPAQEQAEHKPNPKYWVSNLEAAERAAKEHRASARRAWDEFLGNQSRSVAIRHADDARQRPQARYPIYWSSIKTMQPALYSRTPITVSEKCFDSLDDNIARIGAMALERLAKYLMRTCPFDRMFYNVRDTYLHAAKAAPRVMLDEYVGDTPVKEYYTPSAMPGPNGQPIQVYVNSRGEPLPPEVQPQQDEAGALYVEVIQSKTERAEVCLDPVHYCDVLHTPNARHQEEIWWMSYKALLTKEDITDRFGEDVAGRLNYAVISEEDDDRTNNATTENAHTERFCTVWEIWNKRKKQVYWLAKGYTEDFLDVKDDPYELCGFFPSPAFMLGTCGPDDMYPVPDFCQLESLINQLHGMSARLRTLVRAARRRGLADGTIPELKDLANDTDEAEFLLLSNFRQLVGPDGTLDKCVWFFPTAEITQAITEMANVIQLYEAKFNEIYGISDILRGVSDPKETAAAQQLKGQYTSLRFSSMQREFQRVVRDTIELMCDLALKKFPEAKLIDVMGIRHLEPQEQQLWPQVLQLLRDDRERKIRIDIETDSTITMNMNAEIEQRNYLAKTLFEGLAAVATAGQQNQEFMQAGMKVLQFVIRGLQKGKEIEDDLEQIAQRLMNPQPKPDPEMMKTQAKAQIEQIQAQADIATTQAKAQADITRDNIKAQNQMSLEQMRFQHEQQIAQMNASIEELRTRLTMVLDQKKAEHQMELKDRELAIKASAKEAENAFEAPAPAGGDTMIVLGG